MIMMQARCRGRIDRRALEQSSAVSPFLRPLTRTLYVVPALPRVVSNGHTAHLMESPKLNQALKVGVGEWYMLVHPNRNPKWITRGLRESLGEEGLGMEGLVPPRF